MFIAWLLMTAAWLLARITIRKQNEIIQGAHNHIAAQREIIFQLCDQLIECERERKD